MKKVLSVDSWGQELNAILDGQRNSEIELIGNSVSYLMDKLYSSGLQFQNRETLEQALLKITSRCHFTHEEALAKPTLYEYVINWVEAFLYNHQEQWLNVFGLFVSLDEIADEKKTLLRNWQEGSMQILPQLMVQCTSALLNYFKVNLQKHKSLRRANSLNDPLSEQRSEFVLIMERHYSLSLSPHWSLIAIRTLIHLHIWSTLSEDSRQAIVNWVAKERNEWVQNQLLGELANLQPDATNDYSVFVDDFKRFGSHFYSSICEFSPQWKVKAEKPPQENFENYMNDFQPESPSKLAPGTKPSTSSTKKQVEQAFETIYLKQFNQPRGNA